MHARAWALLRLCAKLAIQTSGLGNMFSDHLSISHVLFIIIIIIIIIIDYGTGINAYYTDH